MINLTPCCRMIHVTTSATVVNILGAEHSPKGKAASMKSLPCQIIPSKSQSTGCTGIALYSWRISNLAISKPLPIAATPWTAFSMQTYAREHRGMLTPSLTLLPSGDDKSTISLHFPGVLFGTTPN